MSDVRYARALDGVVQELASLPEGVTPAEVFHAEIPGTWVACPNVAVEPGWSFSGGTFTAPVAAAPSKADLLAYAGAARYAKEIGGISVSGIPIATDDRSKTMILGARVAAEADSTFTTPWVGADGTITTLGAQQIIGIANAVLAHVSACFAAFATLAGEISGGAVTTTAAIDAAFEGVTA